MNKQTTEAAFETYVTEILTGSAGWLEGTSDQWDKQVALFPKRLFSFLEATQPKLWADIQSLHGKALETMLIKGLVKELELKGTLHVLRRGASTCLSTARLFASCYGKANV